MRLAISAILAFGLSLAGLSGALAQSQPNFGPNAPSVGDSYGKPPSGSMHPMSGKRAYAYRSHSYSFFHVRHHRRHHHHY
jgi:hypothetical protein